MNEVSPQTKVAIIGLGHIGKTLATNLIKGKHPVFLASRKIDNSESFAKDLGSLAIAKETSVAIKEADVVIPTMDFLSLKSFFTAYQTELNDKIIIDVSNPIAPDENGGFKKIIADNKSAAQILSELIPRSAKLIKAFGTLGVASLSGEAFAHPEQKVLFYASDIINSNPIIEELIANSGFTPLHIGGLDNAIRIEVFGDLHQFGKLGKTVTLSEAKKKLL